MKKKMKTTIIILKNTLEGFNNRLDEAEERFREIKDRAMELKQSNKKKKKVLSEDSLRTYREHQADRYSGVLEGQERERETRAEKLYEDIMAQNFSAYGKRHSDLRSSVQFSHSVVSDSLQPHESQHTRPPCPSPSPGVHSDSHPSSQ